MQQRLAQIRRQINNLAGMGANAKSSTNNDTEHRIPENLVELDVLASKSAIWDWDLESKRFWHSHGNLRLLGLDKTQATQLVDIEDPHDSWLPQVHPEDRKTVTDALREHWLNGAPYDVEFRFHQAGGDYIWVHSAGEAVRANDGTPLRMTGSNSDITGRIEAEAARHEAERRLSLILENAPTPIISKDAQEHYLYANPTWLNQYGLKLDDILGKTIRELFPDNAAQISPRDRKVVENRSIVEFVYSEELPDGEHEFWVKKFPIPDASGDVEFVIGMEIDITERKLAEDTLRNNEQRLRLLTDNLTALIFNVDGDLCYRFVNRTFEEWNCIDEGSALGKPMAEVMGAEALAQLAPLALRALDGEHVKFERTVSYAAGTRTVSANMAPDFGEDGSVRGFYGLANDISEHKNAEDALKFTQFSLDNAADAVFWFGESGRLEYANRSCERLFGHSRDELAAFHI